MKAFLIGLALVPFLLSCDSSLGGYQQEQNLKLSFLRQCSLQNVVTDRNEINILDTGVCKDIDCQLWLQDEQYNINMYSIEDLFLRGIHQYVIIDDVDMDNWSYIDVSVHKVDTLKKMRIK